MNTCIIDSCAGKLNGVLGHKAICGMVGKKTPSNIWFTTLSGHQSTCSPEATTFQSLNYYSSFCVPHIISMFLAYVNNPHRVDKLF